MYQPIRTCLPGTLTLSPGTPEDYFALEHFHYVARRPATWAGVWTVRYRDDASDRIVAVGCLSYPTLSCRARERALRLGAMSRAERIAFANAFVRTISRVVVHPQFRALGLAAVLVRRMIDECPTRYVESLASMGRVHPLFERAGMGALDSGREEEPVYYWIDRAARDECVRGHHR